MKVLIADDELVYLKIVEKMIRGWGYEVVQVTDGVQAWKLLETDPGIHIVLLDWMMPGMDGLTICKHVRQREGMPYVAVLMMSARDQQSDIEQGYIAGVDDYLVKPINSSQLKQRLQVAERVVKMERELRNSSDVLTRLVSSLGHNHEKTAENESSKTTDLSLCLSLALASCKYGLRPYANVVQEPLPKDDHGHMVKIPMIRGDAQRIEDVLVRLILDSAEAIKGNAKGTLHIAISINRTHVQLVLEDDAPTKFHGNANFHAEIRRSLELQSATFQANVGANNGIHYCIDFSIV